MLTLTFQGTAITFFTSENSKSARELIAILREAKAEIPAELSEMAQYGGGGGGRGGRGRGRGGFGGGRGGGGGRTGSNGMSLGGGGGGRW